MTVGNDADHGLAYREVKVRTGLRYFRHQGRVCRPTRLRTGFWTDVPILRANNLSRKQSITLLLCNQGSRSADRLLHGSVPISISHSPLLFSSCHRKGKKRAERNEVDIRGFFLFGFTGTGARTLAVQATQTKPQTIKNRFRSIAE